MEHRTQTLRSIWFHKLPCEGTAFRGCGETCKNWRLGFLKGAASSRAGHCFLPTYGAAGSRAPLKIERLDGCFSANSFNHADQDRQIWADL
jgi:hypothetical protein